MGIDPTGLPERIFNRMVPQDRQKYERKPRRTLDPEIALHNQIWGFLLRHDFEDIEYSNPRRKTRARLGRPDFLICRHNRRLGIECKIAPNKLSPEQEEFFAMAERQGNTCVVCYTYESAVAAIQTFFKLSIYAT